MEKIHAKGFVHNSLKPENICFCVKTQQVSVIDFGKAVPTGTRFKYDNANSIEELKLKFPRVAPEILKGQPCTPKSDTWTIGHIAEEIIGTEKLAPILRKWMELCVLENPKERPTISTGICILDNWLTLIAKYNEGEIFPEPTPWDDVTSQQCRCNDH